VTSSEVGKEIPAGKPGRRFAPDQQVIFALSAALRQIAAGLPWRWGICFQKRLHFSPASTIAAMIVSR
jgi:hypothetical protein